MTKNNTLAKPIAPLHSILALIVMVMIPLMLWDLFVLGLPSEGSLARKPFAPTSFELIAMVGFWMATSITTLWYSIKPVWDNYVKVFLDTISYFLTIREVYKWIKNKRTEKKKRK